MPVKCCKKCGKEKDLESFYAHKAMADGRLSECKECTKSRVTARREENIDAVRAYDRARSKDKKRIKNAIEQTKKWRAEDSRRMAAHNAVARAMRSGALIRRPCERCGSDRSYAHHESYDRPLEVVWLCQPDHKQRHKEMAIEGIEP